MELNIELNVTSKLKKKSDCLETTTENFDKFKFFQDTIFCHEHSQKNKNKNNFHGSLPNTHHRNRNRENSLKLLRLCGDHGTVKLY